MKYLWFLLPLAFMWVCFYVGSLVGFGGELDWWEMPFLYSCVALVFVAILISVNRFLDD